MVCGPKAADVLKVLEELGVSAETTPIIEVWNKIDLLEQDADGTRPALATMSPQGKVAATAAVSAQTGDGLPKLLETIEQVLGGQGRTYKVQVPHSAGADIAWLYGHAEILGKAEPDDDGQVYEVRVDPRYASSFVQRFAGRIDGLDAA